MTHKVLILTPHLHENITKNSPYGEYDDLINFDVQRYIDRFTLMKIRGHKITCGLIPPFSLSAVFALKKATNEFKPDVVNVHYVMPTGLAALYAQKILKIPTVMTYNGRDVPGPGVPKIWKFWHRLVGSNCQDMTFVSKYCRDVIYGINSKHGHVIYNGVDNEQNISQEELHKFCSKVKLNKKTKIIFSLQRLDYLKRVDIIIESMPKILNYEKNVCLVVGGTGPDLTRLKRLVNEKGLENRVIFTEFISHNQLPLYFSMADIFAFHSTYETFGMVIAEAMNYRKAIVSANNTAIKEIVDNKINGILVPTDHKRYQIGNEGKKRVEKLFRWDSIASKYEVVLENASSTKKIIL